MKSELKEWLDRKFPDKKVLFFTIKREWYKLIKSGTKTEEYRDINPYWQGRLFSCRGSSPLRCEFGLCNRCGRKTFKEYDIIIFFNGPYYSLNLPYTVVEYNGVEIGKGYTPWGAPVDKDVFIVKLGKVLE